MGSHLVTEGFAIDRSEDVHTRTYWIGVGRNWNWKRNTVGVVQYLVRR